jgi:hypothetical protein
VSDALRNLRLGLLRNSQVSHVTHAIDVQRLRGGELYIEGYVDAELINGHGIVWWLEAIEKDDSWSVEPEVRVQLADRQERLISLAVRTASYSELPQALVDAVNGLVATLAEVDLARI